MKRALAPLPFLLLVCAAPATAQERVCDYTSEGRTTSTARGGMEIIEFLDAFTVRCTDGTLVRASAGTWDRTVGEVLLDGNVFFEDPERELTADRAVYNTVIGRLEATGDVHFRDRVEGSTIEGPELEYFRAMQGRPEPLVRAGQRPHLTLEPRERSDESEPLEIDADDVEIRGEDELEAAGDVVIIRSDLRATSREARHSGATGALELRGGARIVSGDYDLAGDVIRGTLTDGELQEVNARTDARLVGEDLTVDAADLQLFFDDERLQRAVARGLRERGDSAALTGRPVARSRTFELEADSIDAALPGQRLEQVVAIGGARGTTIDTLGGDEPARPTEPADSAAEPEAPSDSAAAAAGARELIENDWIEGDTIIGYFASAAEVADSAAPRPAAADTGGVVVMDVSEPPADRDAPTGGETADTALVLERIQARGSALALYRVARADSAGDGRRGIEFISGELIELTFHAGELVLAEVTDLQRGLHLDPAEPARREEGETGEPDRDRNRAGGAGGGR